MSSVSSRKTTARATRHRQHKGSVEIKRAYEPPQKTDGRRVLELDAWYRDVAPSTALRKWFGHDPERWPEFRKRYLAELRSADLREPLDELTALCARDEEHNQAVVLREYLRRRTSRAR